MEILSGQVSRIRPFSMLQPTSSSHASSAGLWRRRKSVSTDWYLSRWLRKSSPSPGLAMRRATFTCGNSSFRVRSTCKNSPSRTRSSHRKLI